MNIMNEDLLQQNTASDSIKGSDIQVSLSSSPASVISSTGPLYYNDKLTVIDTTYIDDRIATVLQDNREAFDVDDLINLLLLLDEKVLQEIIASLEFNASGRQLSCANYLVSRLIRQRHFSEDFLLNCLRLIEDKNDFLVIHRYEITSGQYSILQFHLKDDPNVRDIA